MNTPRTQRNSLSIIAASALLGCATIAQGDISINDAGMDLYNIDSTVAGAHYRMSNSKWDMALDNGKGTSSSSNFISSNLGNNKALSEQTFSFTLTHRAGEGFIWELFELDAKKPTIQAWGDFDSKPSGSVKSKLGGLTPGADFNSLFLEATSLTSGSSMEFSNLVFSSASLPAPTGDFVAGVVSPSVSGPGNSAGLWTQRLLSTSSLAAADWSLTGLLHGVRGGSGGDNDVQFSISAQQTSFSVPAPAAAALLGVVGLFIRVGSRRSNRD